MSIFNHNIYDNVRTRVIVLSEGHILLIPTVLDSPVWRLPGGGLKTNESLSECAQREILEETGIHVAIGRVAFLREWVVPRYTPSEPPQEGHGFGLEIYFYASPLMRLPDLHPENTNLIQPRWVTWNEVLRLPLWPKEIKYLCQKLMQGEQPPGCLSFISQLESPTAELQSNPFKDEQNDE